MSIRPTPSTVATAATSRSPGMRLFLGVRNMLLCVGGGDARALDYGGATVTSLTALGLVNLLVSFGSSTLIAISCISFFGFSPAWTAGLWIAAIGIGLVIALMNMALMHGMFESYGTKQLSIVPARHEIPQLPVSQSKLLALRLLIATAIGAFLMVPVKLTLTQADQAAEIANEQNRRNLPYAKAARESADKTIDDLWKRVDALRLPIAALIFEKSMIETARLGGETAAVPAEFTAHIRGDIVALAKKAEALSRQHEEQNAAHDEEMKLVRHLDQNISVLTRQRRQRDAAAIARQRNAAQQRANTLARQIAATTGDIDDVRARLDIQLAAVQLQLDQFQNEAKDNKVRRDAAEKARDQLIAERTQSTPGYQLVSSGFIGRIESLGRLWNSSPTARVAMLGIVALIAVLDLMPLLMKAAIKLPAYALRIASEGQRAFTNEAAATLSSDIQLMRLVSQVEAELDGIRKIKHQRLSDWYRNYPPLTWIRLVSMVNLLRRREESDTQEQTVNRRLTDRAA
jgi:Domain of unknown function (DUF4407)